MSARILLLETASRRCDVALMEGDQLVYEVGSVDPNGFQHAEVLHVYLQRLIQETGYAVSSFDAIALSAGPGSYTGLRIGAASAKGLVAPYDLPLIAYSSLQALSHAGMEARGEFASEATFWAAMDARRMEVYSALFDGNGQRLSDDAPQLLEEEPIPAGLPNQHTVYGVGDGVAKAIPGFPGLQDLGIPYASARHGAKLALAAFNAGEAVDAAAFSPNYLKAFRAGVPRLGLPVL